MERRYQTDLTDERRGLVEPLVHAARGRPPSDDRRRAVDAIPYLLRTGCRWRMPPEEFPCRSTARSRFRRRKRTSGGGSGTARWDGTLDRPHEAPRAAERTRQGRDPAPTAAALDGRSVKTAEKGGRGATTRTNK